MGKNDFDIDFDFEEEYGFDPKNFLGDEEYDSSIDLNAFTDEELGLTAPKPEENDSFDADEDEDLDDFLNMADQVYEEEEEEDWEEDSQDEEPEEEDDDTESQDYEAGEDDDPEETDMDEMEYTDETILDVPQEYEEAEDVEYDEDAPEYEEGEDIAEYDPEEPEEPKKKRPKKERKKAELPKLPKFTMPPVFTKFYDVYFAPVLHKELREEPQPEGTRRRRRKSRQQIFKEFYLPPILVCVSLILVLSFLIGSVTNAIELKKIEDQKEQSQLDASISAAEQAQMENQRIVNEAAALAAQYDYDSATALLRSINGGDLTAYPEISAKLSEYEVAKSQLVEHKEPSMIPNLSFHVLVADMARAMQDTDGFKGNYNKNFVSCDEFSKILSELYNNGYVLVDFDSFVAAQTDLDGTQKFLIDPIKLPQGKKPVMITETMVNYFAYMNDSDGDGVADSKGDGFASRLVVDGNGDIKAEYIDATGQTLTGNYDLVPILEDFIRQHPDFSYRGARAILAVTGHEGVFGYRCNTTYISTKSQDFYDQQVAGAKQIAQALRDKGYTIASYTYSNKDYAQFSVAQISADLTSWTNEVTNVIGPVDTIVFAKNSDLTDYNGQGFQVLYRSGFRYFIGRASDPYCEVNTTYVRQKRLLVTGENMRHYASQFTDDGLFNPNAVLDLTSRGGEIPKS